MTTTTAPTSDAEIFDVDEPEVAEPEVIEPEPQPPAAKTKRKTAAEVAKVDDKAPEVHKVVLDEGWQHERLEFRGDQLAVRRPKKSALGAVVLVSSKYVAMDVQNDTIGLFMARHLGPVSYGHVMNRMLNPDDADYTDDTVMVLLNKIMELGGDEPEKDADAADSKPE